MNQITTQATLMICTSITAIKQTISAQDIMAIVHSKTMKPLSHEMEFALKLKALREQQYV